MITGNNGLQLIRDAEGLSLKPYVDVDRFAIGYGNNFYENGTPVKLSDPPITAERAEALLKRTVSTFEGYIKKYINVNLTQNQFDALVSLVYNIGPGDFQTSTIRKVINKDPNDPLIRNEFMRWNKSKGEVLGGLTKRRQIEADLYFSGSGDPVDIQELVSTQSDAIVNDDSGDVISRDDGGDYGGSGGSNTNNSLNVGIENITKPTIKVEPIVYNSPVDNSIDVPIGKKPFIWFNDIQIDTVEKFSLNSSDFLPTISIVFRDSYGYFDNLRFANDDDRVRVFIDSKSDLIRPIFLEFKILKFTKVEEGLFSMKGSLNVNKMYITEIESYSNSTSFEVLRRVSEQSGLGFSTNVSNTDDSMTWVNYGNRGMEFCRDVIKRSYRNESSFMWGFVDFYYNLNFIDIETQLNWNISNQFGIATTDLDHIQAQLKLSDDESASMVYLSNDSSSHGSSNFFESYRIFNNSTRKSIDKGYRSRVKYYDWKSKDFLIFETESIKSNDINSLILKSDDSEFLQDNVRHFWEGKMISNNVHSNYLYTNRQNETNINELQKIGMTIVLPVPNYNLYKFMKVFILLINQGTSIINPIYNAKLSGDWLVTDIQLFLDNGELKQRVKLIRRELGFSQEEVSDESS